jgi:hypothetical protein
MTVTEETAHKNHIGNIAMSKFSPRPANRSACKRFHYDWFVRKGDPTDVISPRPVQWTRLSGRQAITR